ncbi:MAG TPA: hypothetical protein VEB22_05310 [Phycisphaerales bacterium]|nr:hypothetical protein [Phycisphaerales bacterium]
MLIEVRRRVAGRTGQAARHGAGKALHAVSEWARQLVDEIAATADHLTEDGPLTAPPAPQEFVAEQAAAARPRRKV